MSILFQALNKAARDHKHQSPSIVVPLIALEQPPRWQWKFWLMIGIVAIAFGSGLVAYFFHNQAQPLATAVPASVPAIQAQASPQKAKFKHGVIAENQSMGIALPAESLAAPQEVEATREVAQQLATLPVITGKHGVASKPQIEVTSAPASSVAAILKAAQSAVRSGNEAEALARYDEILDRDRSNTAAWNGKITVLSQAGQYLAAARLAQAWNEQDPSSATAQAALIMALGQWKSPEALDTLHRMAKTLPQSASIHAALAQQETLPVALTEWQQAVKLEPNNIQYRLSLAILYDRMGDGEKALEHYRAVVAMHGDNSVVLPMAWDMIQQRMDYLASHAPEQP